MKPDDLTTEILSHHRTVICFTTGTPLDTDNPNEVFGSFIHYSQNSFFLRNNETPGTAAETVRITESN
jgi:hypothetical protein